MDVCDTVDYKCSFCKSTLENVFADLGVSPLANSFLKDTAAISREVSYPLVAYVCHKCLLVQLGVCVEPQTIFNDYAYFSSYSSSWLEHAKRYVSQIISKFNINTTWQVVEIGSNDGYLLKNFLSKNIPVLGIEPAANIAKVATAQGINTREMYFGVQAATQLRQEGLKANLIIANNVLAHVPNVNDFLQGISILLASDGFGTFEIPHLAQLIAKHEFDTIYHEHYYYYSMLTLNKILQLHNLKIFDVAKIAVHGGSLRIFYTHANCNQYAIQDAVAKLMQEEQAMGLDKLSTYLNFNNNIKDSCRQVRNFLKSLSGQAKQVVAYGAPAKGNTLLNYCAIDRNILSYTVDKNPTKQGCLLPGSHIPIYHPDKIFETKPDYVLILPWNLQHEIVTEMQAINAWGGKFVVPIPIVQVLE